MAGYTLNENHEQLDSSSTSEDLTNGGGRAANVEQNCNSDHSIRTTAPNGGWGWIVALSAFLIRMLIDGICYSSGFFFIEMKHHFKATNSQTSWTVSLLYGTYHAIGPVISFLISLFGWRCVTIFGACLLAGSFIACTWSPNVVIVIVLYGLMGGIGMCSLYVPSVVSVGHYFTTKRSLAMGVSACGSGLGGLAFAPLVEYLIALYGWRGAMWIVAGIVLHGIPIGALLRPLDDPKQTRKLEEMDINTGGDDSLDRKDVKQSCSNLRSGFGIELFHSPTFVLYWVSCFVCFLGIYTPLTYLPDYAEDVGHSAQEAAWLIATFGIFNTISRALVGWVGGKRWSDVIMINNAVLVTGGIATICVPYYHSLIVLIMYSAVLGVILGVFVVMNAIILAELLGIEKLTPAFGLVNAAGGFAAIIGVPIAGALVDTTGDTVAAFYWAGSVLTISGVLCFPLRRINKWERRRKFISVRSMVTEDIVIEYKEKP